MSDYISRDAAIIALAHRKCGNDEYDIAVQDCIETLKHFPAADVKPVVRGKWVNAAGNEKCSNCGMIFPDLFPLYDKASYCPNCGADMKDQESHGAITRAKLRSMSAGEINRHWEEIQKALKGKRTEGRKQPEEYFWPQKEEGNP